MKFDKDHIDIIINSLNEGDGRVRACKAANISYETFLDWQNPESPRYNSEFSEAVKKAETNGNDKIKDICKRRIIEDKSWQSAAWWLERNFKHEYAIKQEIDHTTKGEKITDEVDYSKLTNEDRTQMIALSRKLRE